MNGASTKMMGYVEWKWHQGMGEYGLHSRGSEEIVDG